MPELAGEEIGRCKEAVAYARSRPRMYMVNPPDTAHRDAASAAIELIDRARPFRRSTGIELLLAPHQFVLRGLSGPLLTAVQTMFPVSRHVPLTRQWDLPMKKLCRLNRTRSERGFTELSGWMSLFASPAGPRLDSPLVPMVLARRFGYGLRVDAGMWYQAFADGVPTMEPTLLEDAGPVGLLVLGEVEEVFYPGLPFGPEDVAFFSSIQGVTVRWTPADLLIRDDAIKPPGVLGFLSKHLIA